MDYHLMKHQILRINFIGNAWPTVRRISTKILGVKELHPHNINNGRQKTSDKRKQT